MRLGEGLQDRRVQPGAADMSVKVLAEFERCNGRWAVRLSEVPRGVQEEFSEDVTAAGGGLCVACYQKATPEELPTLIEKARAWRKAVRDAKPKRPPRGQR